MISKDERVRAAIADQAGEWFVTNDDAPLDAHQSAALVAWLKESPVHVEEFLAVSVIARDLREACADPEYSAESVLASARADDDTPALPLWPRAVKASRNAGMRRWLTAPVAMAAAVGVLSLGLLLLWNLRPIAHVSAPVETTVLHFETRHGELLTRRLADNSVLRLDTDTAVTVQYSKTARTVTLTSGQADFEVAHETGRPFRVFAGPAEVIAVGTKFDVRLEHDSTLVTVVEGRVAVGAAPPSENRGLNPGEMHPAQFVQLAANQQLRLIAGEWPPTLGAVDADRTTAWLHRQIAFDHVPLEQVAAEINRYAPKPFVIVTPTLRSLQISGVFATDDTEAFTAFLRSLEGVQVDVTATRVRVSQN